jgi:hypothetical protein
MPLPVCHACVSCELQRLLHTAPCDLEADAAQVEQRLAAMHIGDVRVAKSEALAGNQAPEGCKHYAGIYDTDSWCTHNDAPNTAELARVLRQVCDSCRTRHKGVSGGAALVDTHALHDHATHSMSKRLSLGLEQRTEFKMPMQPAEQDFVIGTTAHACVRCANSVPLPKRSDRHLTSRWAAAATDAQQASACTSRWENNNRDARS